MASSPLTTSTTTSTSTSTSITTTTSTSTSTSTPTPNVTPTGEPISSVKFLPKWWQNYNTHLQFSDSGELCQVENTTNPWKIHITPLEVRIRREELEINSEWPLDYGLDH
jgi:type II secretory pathway component HofQ